jgi:hypothetical protein
MRRIAFLVMALVTCSIASGLSGLAAHDMWLVPRSHIVDADSDIRVVVAVGMDFPNSEHAIAPQRLTPLAICDGSGIDEFRFSHSEADKQTTITITPSREGAWIIGCSTRPNRIELEAGEFNSYLLHDGMPHVLAGRIERGELERDAIEQYSKYTKTLVVSGQAEPASLDAAVATPVGHRLEILLERNPHACRPGTTLTAQVLFDGEPLPHANLCWDHPGNGHDFSGHSWTDPKGKAMVPLARPGLMTLRLVHMTRPEGAEHEWESFWSSFTFVVDGVVDPDGLTTPGSGSHRTP